jgi:hypothetical protein
MGSIRGQPYNPVIGMNDWGIHMDLRYKPQLWEAM